MHIILLKRGVIFVLGILYILLYMPKKSKAKPKEELKKAGAPAKAKARILENLENGNLQLYLQQGKPLKWILDKIDVAPATWCEYVNLNKKGIPELINLYNKYKKNRLSFVLEQIEDAIQSKIVQLKTIDADGNETIKEQYIYGNSQLMKWMAFNYSRSLEKSERLLNDTDTPVKLEELEIKRRELEIKERELALKEEELKQKQQALEQGIGITDEIDEWFENIKRKSNVSGDEEAS